MRLLLLAGVATSLWLGSPCCVLAQSADPVPVPSNQPSRQIQRCQKLAAQINRLRGSRQGPSAASRAYAAGIAKLTKRYGYDPCPGVKAPNV